jgi:hypothetical protein
MPYQKLIKNTNTVPSGEKKYSSMQISVYNPATGCSDAAIRAALEGEGTEATAEPNQPAVHLSTLGHQGAATLSTQSLSSN